MRAKINLVRSLAIATGLAATFGAAQAADVVYEEPAAPQPIIDPTPVASWAGGYIGLSGSYGFGAMANTNVGTIANNGFIVSGFGGVQGQRGSFVYGAEADIGYNFGRNTVGGTTTAAGLEGSLRARLGGAVSDRVLLYGTAGLAATNVSVTDAAGTASGAQLGYTVGAGADIKFTEKVFGRLEYRYTDSFARTYNTGSGPQTIDYNNHRVMVGLGVAF